MIETLLLTLIGVLLGTYGLAWMHYLVHRYNLFNISVFWKYHLIHHGKNDPEQILRRKHTMPVYGLVSSLKYLNVSKWGPADFIFFATGMVFPKIFIVSSVGIFIAENIGFLQHDYDGNPIDFTNKFDNLIGLNQGYHSDHHGKIKKYEVDTQILYGLFFSYLWLAIVFLLYPFLIFNTKKPTIPGAYIGNFFQNVANYRAQEGLSIKNLVYRMPSIFDNPSILLYYVRIIFGFKTDYGPLSHPISQIRNVYNFIEVKNRRILVKDGKIIEGHHRYLSNPNAQWDFVEV